MSSRHSRSLLLAARFVLLVGVMLSMAGFWQATHISRQAEEDRMTGAFLLDASDRFEMVGRELDRSAGAVHALRNFFMASREVSDEEFRTFGQPVLDRRPELHALFWMPAEGTIDAPRFPVRQVATKDGSTLLLGQDLATEPDLRAALERSRDGGELVAILRPPLCSRIREQLCQLLILPVYAGAYDPADVGTRRASLRGFVMAGILPAKLLHQAVAGLEKRGVSLWLMERGGEGEARLVAHQRARLAAPLPPGLPPPPPPTEGRRLEKVHAIGGQALILIAAPAAGTDHYRAERPAWPWLVLAGGLFLTLLAFFHLRSLHRHALGQDALNRELEAEIGRHRLHERELEKVGRALQLIRTSNHDLIHADDEHRLLQRVCGNAVAHGYRLAWVGFAEQDEARGVRVVAVAGHDEGYTDGLALSWADVPRGRGRGPAGTAIRTGTTCVLGDLAVAPGFDPWREAALLRGYQALACLPLMEGGTAFGVLCIYAAEAGAFDAGEIDLLKELALDLAFGISALRTRHEHAVMEAQLEHQAYYDELTGLPRRAVFVREVGTALERARAHGGALAVMLVDLDNFKLINDTRGHPAGDALLRDVAARLRGAMPEGALLARLSGDKFLILLTCPEVEADPIEIIIERVAGRARAILRILEAPFLLSGAEIYMRASIGISRFPDHSENVDDLIRHADAALYLAKTCGRNGYRFYSSDISARQQRRLDLEGRLHRALAGGELHLLYQPIVELASGRMVGVEALARWRDPERGMISPAEFIPVAEDSGLIKPLGEWVVREACRQLAAWRAGGMETKVAVNLSVRQFGQGDVVEMVERMAREAGLPPALIELEVTESAMMLETGELEAQVRRMAEAGFSISLDDFGTGFSSLSRIAELPIHVLKVDKSFVDEMLTDRTRWAIVNTVIQFASHLGVHSLAEGIETAEQWAELHRLGCQYGQGYHFRRPSPAEDVEQIWRGGQPLPSAPAEG
ncbi:MAG: EAL domain-containing protein [Halothiobacillaceae bacterium]|nr:MAG: EAL domain-containing protein [Halothiobacillaceae bacterium]